MHRADLAPATESASIHPETPRRVHRRACELALPVVAPRSLRLALVGVVDGLGQLGLGHRRAPVNVELPGPLVHLFARRTLVVDATERRGVVAATNLRRRVRGSFSSLGSLLRLAWAPPGRGAVPRFVPGLGEGKTVRQDSRRANGEAARKRLSMSSSAVRESYFGTQPSSSRARVVSTTTGCAAMSIQADPVGEMRAR